MKTIIGIILTLSMCLIFINGQANGAILIVTKTADTNDNVCDADCSLREAIFAAAASGDEIQFASPLFDTPQVITLNPVIVSGLTISKSLTITGKGANLLTVTRNTGASVSPIIIVQGTANLNLSGMTISHVNPLEETGISISSGTGTINNISNCVFTGNRSGITVGGSGTLNLINSSVWNNTLDAGAGNHGAGITAQSATVNIINSTISGNADNNPNVNNENAGAIRYSGSGNISITNSTITNNSTIGNSRLQTGGIGHIFGTLTIRNSIVAGNIGGISDVYSDNQFAPYVSEGYNLIGTNDQAAFYFPVGNPNANNDIVGTSGTPIDPLLTPLGMYGGTIPTHGLQISPIASPAIDKGSNLGGLTTDQRGLMRPFDNPLIMNSGGANANGSDIGSFEVQAVTAANVSVSGRILSMSGSGVYRAHVFYTDASETVRSAVTNSFGYFRFDAVQTGATYIFQVQNKQHVFAPQPVFVAEEIRDLNFVSSFSGEFK
jgi:CSLREA domain-containing protein